MIIAIPPKRLFVDTIIPHNPKTTKTLTAQIYGRQGRRLQETSARKASQNPSGDHRRVGFGQTQRGSNSPPAAPA